MQNTTMICKTAVLYYLIFPLISISFSKSLDTHEWREMVRIANHKVRCTPPSARSPQRLPPQLLKRGGTCPIGTVCFEEYHDSHAPYDENCDLPWNVDFTYVCHDEISDDLEYGKCEADKLDRRISWELNEMVRVSSTLKRGATCRHKDEWELRNWYRLGWESLNKYRMLALLERERAPHEAELEFIGGPFCDVGKLLECKRNNLCDCVADTIPRRVIVDGKEYLSEHCYLTSGSCNGRDVTEFVAVSGEEQDRIWDHYGEPLEDLCAVGNVCAYLDEKKRKCRNSPNF